MSEFVGVGEVVETADPLNEETVLKNRLKKAVTLAENLKNKYDLEVEVSKVVDFRLVSSLIVL